MSQQRSINVSHWLGGPADFGNDGTDITVWPLGEGANRHAELADRLSIAMHTGNASLSLKPTAAEARALIAALQWALEPEEVPA